MTRPEDGISIQQALEFVKARRVPDTHPPADKQTYGSVHLPQARYAAFNLLPAIRDVLPTEGAKISEAVRRLTSVVGGGKGEVRAATPSRLGVRSDILVILEALSSMLLGPVIFLDGLLLGLLADRVLATVPPGSSRGL